MHRSYLNDHNDYVIGAATATRQRGASMAEFITIAPILMLIGLGTVQAGLVYHGKTTLNYATFEAARAGATRHAQPGPMRRELGARLGAIYGGDGSTEMVANAIARSMIELESPVNLDGSLAPPTRLEILNPTIEAFDAWGKPSLEHDNRTVIPNSHLRHQNASAGAGTPGLTLRDANLLKIEVTHGFELKVPLVSKLLTGALTIIDPENALFYASGRLPIKSVATVRMQSEAWKESIELANAPPVVSGVPDDPADPSDPTDVTDSSSPDGPDDFSGGPGQCDDGLPFSTPLNPIDDGICLVENFPISTPVTTPTGGNEPLSSPVSPINC